MNHPKGFGPWYTLYCRGRMAHIIRTEEFAGGRSSKTCHEASRCPVDLSQDPWSPQGSKAPSFLPKEFLVGVFNPLEKYESKGPSSRFLVSLHSLELWWLTAERIRCCSSTLSGGWTHFP